MTIAYTQPASSAVALRNTYRPAGVSLRRLIGWPRLAGAALFFCAVSSGVPTTARAQDAGDAAAGEKVFARCKACHQVGEKARNGVGPQLNGVVGRASAAVADYRYSPAMQKAGLTWDPATLQAFLRNPKTVVPGTKMTTAGLTKETDFSNLLTYLEQFSNTVTSP